MSTELPESNKRWAILIGIDGYHDSLGQLSFCQNDAKLMRQTLLSEACGFAPENVILLGDDEPKDRQPTFGNIHSWLGTWLSRPGPEDLVVVYFAGHGREAKGSPMLAPLDATLDSLHVTGIPVQYVRDLLERCKARQKVLLLDACHSGSGRDVAAMTASFRTELEAGKGIYTIASCDSDQISYEWPEKRQGVFSYYLAEAIIRFAPASPDGLVSLDAVYEWTRKKVLDWSARHRIRQEPVRLCHTAGDIALARRQGGPDVAPEVSRRAVQSETTKSRADLKGQATPAPDRARPIGMPKSVAMFVALLILVAIVAAAFCVFGQVQHHSLKAKRELDMKAALAAVGSGDFEEARAVAGRHTAERGFRDEVEKAIAATFDRVARQAFEANDLQAISELQRKAAGHPDLLNKLTEFREYFPALRGALDALNKGDVKPMVVLRLRWPAYPEVMEAWPIVLQGTADSESAARLVRVSDNALSGNVRPVVQEWLSSPNEPLFSQAAAVAASRSAEPNATKLVRTAKEALGGNMSMILEWKAVSPADSLSRQLYEACFAKVKDSFKLCTTSLDGFRDQRVAIRCRLIDEPFWDRESRREKTGWFSSRWVPTGRQRACVHVHLLDCTVYDDSSGKDIMVPFSDYSDKTWPWTVDELRRSGVVSGAIVTMYGYYRNLDWVLAPSDGEPSCHAAVRDVAGFTIHQQ